MKKILLTAIVALIGLSAYAVDLPKAGDVGYLYNPASGKFIGADAKLADEGTKFTIEIKSKDSSATPSVEGAAFMRFKTGSNYLTFFTEPVTYSTYYGQLVVKATDKGLLITHPYPNDSGPEFMKNDPTTYTGSYLQVVNGELTVAALDESNEGAYWLYVDEETYAKIVGPTYPIALTGALGTVTIEYTGTSSAESPYSAKFSVSEGFQNVIQYKPFDVSEFIKYGYKKIVIEFASAVDNVWRFHSYGGQFDNIEEIGGKTTHELALSGNSIDDFTIFNWQYDQSLATIEIAACYFSKEELATSISTVKSVQATQKAIFNAAGQQMKALQKGLNIVDGKKIYVK